MPTSTHKVARINRRSGEASSVRTALYICVHTCGTSHPLTCMCSLELPQLPLVLLVKLPHHLSGRPLHRGMGRMGRQTPVTRTKTPAHSIVSTSPRPQPSWRLVREPPIQEVGGRPRQHTKLPGSTAAQVRPLLFTPICLGHRAHQGQAPPSVDALPSSYVPKSV